MLEIRRALKDILAGALFVALGLAFSFGSLAYDIGTPLRMGAGFFPLVVGIVLVGFGIAVVVKGLLAGEGDSLGGFDLRAVVFITAALLFFAFTVRGLGVAPALFGGILLASLGRSRTRVHEALLIALGLTVLSIVIFVVLLRLRLPLTGPWLPI
ncbi:MAG TPA: tripartite tricarboxylate transporter TctB family protein [Candidatus Limnocylindria bacterium]|nr:tripartite tricarboxylate transporter TctB family protein [Candidatus Limnocylindria bacterium]